MFARLGRFVVRNPWKVIAVWVIAAIGFGMLSPGLSATTDQSDFLPRHYESIQAMDLQKAAFPDAAPPAAIILFERKDGKPLTPQDSATVQQAVTTLDRAKVPKIKHVVLPPSMTGAAPAHGSGGTPGAAAAPRRAEIAVVTLSETFSPNNKDQTNSVKTLRADLKPELANTDLKAGITGQIAEQYDNQDTMKKAMAIVILATVVLILGLLLLIFRGPLAALVPIVVLGAIVSFVALSLIAFAAKGFDLKVDSSSETILSVVLFGVGTDYILFLMFRFRERLRLGEDPKTAVVNAVTRVGEAITSAAGAVIIAFATLTLSTLGMFRALGPALAIMVAVTLLAGLTLVPAVMSLLGTKVFWPSKAWQSEPKGSRFAALGKAMGRRPAAFALGSGLVLIVLTIFAFGYHPSFDMESGSTSSTAESVVYNNELKKFMPAGATQPSDVFLKSTTGQPLTQQQLTTFGAALPHVPGVGQVNMPSAKVPNTLAKDGTVADFQVTLNSDPKSDAALNTVRGPLRDVAHSQAPPGTVAYVGGGTSVMVDIEAACDHDYRVVFPVAAILIMVVLGLLLRSVVAPWYLMASVGLGFGATLGATVLVFQHFKGQSGLIFMLPVMMYLFVVALGTDYNILMIARLREEAREGLSPRDAAAMSLRHAGPTVASAGLILAGTFASMLLAGNSLLQSMGFAISFGIAIAAFVMALFFTPALTAMIGHIAWWPGHGDQRAGDDAEPHRELVDSVR